MIFLHVDFEFFEKRDPSFGPLGVFRVLFLVFSQDAVGVELSGVGHFFDVGRRRRFDSHPTQGGDGFADGGQVVEHFLVGAILFANVADFCEEKLGGARLRIRRKRERRR